MEENMNTNANVNQNYQAQYQNNQAPCQRAADAKPKRSPGKKGFILGLISVILLPLFYNPFMLWIVWLISIFGLIYSIKGLSITPKGFAVAGLILSALPIALHFAVWLVSDLITRFG